MPIAAPRYPALRPLPMTHPPPSPSRHMSNGSRFKWSYLKTNSLRARSSDVSSVAALLFAQARHELCHNAHHGGRQLGLHALRSCRPGGTPLRPNLMRRAQTIRHARANTLHTFNFVGATIQSGWLLERASGTSTARAFAHESHDRLPCARRRRAAALALFHDALLCRVSPPAILPDCRLQTTQTCLARWNLQ